MPTRELPPLPHDPTVSVVVPVRDAAATLPDTVAAALQPEVDELVLAVDADDAASWVVAEELQRQHPGLVRAVANPGGRTPEALNLAIAASSGQVVVRVDAHAVLPPGYVHRVVETLRRTGAGNVGGRQVPTARGGFAGAVAHAMVSPLGAGGAAYRTGTTAGPADTVYLGAFRREALAAVGGYDPRFTRNQDAELNLRLRRSGYVVWFEPELAVAYRPRSRPAALARQYFEYGRWRRLTVRTHRGSLVARQLAPVGLVAALTASVLGSVALRDARPVVWTSSAYLGATLVGAAATTHPVQRAPATAAALVIMHLAWGVGFVLGPPRHAAGDSR